MTAKSWFLEDELCCSVCCGIFKEPVLLLCSHSFCRDCLRRCWEEKSSRECPICRRQSTLHHPPLNLVLKNVVETYSKQRGSPVENRGPRCELHHKKLLFFCEDDQEPICTVCQTSKNHRSHQICPVEGAALDRKEELFTALDPIKEKLRTSTRAKQACMKTAQHINSQAQHTERQIKAEFEKLHQFLREEEEVRLAALREEEEQKSRIMEEKIENIARNISSLSDKITAIEKAIESEDISFLKIYKDTKRRAQCTLQDPELLSGALIDVAKHLGNLKFIVWEKMLGVVQYTPVTLDPNTVHPCLSLRDDLTRVRNTGDKRPLPDNPERFDFGVAVLGSEGYTSGKHSWEVGVGNKPSWSLGVARKSVDRKGQIRAIPEKGFWVLSQRNWDLYGACSSEKKCIKLRRKPQRIRVQLDYDRGVVSFFDPSDMTQIYTCKGTFRERMFPFLSPYLSEDGSNPGALTICPGSVLIIAMPFQ